MEQQREHSAMTTATYQDWPRHKEQKKAGKFDVNSGSQIPRMWHATTFFLIHLNICIVSRALWGHSTVLEDWKVGRGYSNSFPNSHTTGLVVLQSWKHQFFPESSGFIFFEWLHTVRWEKSSLLKWCNQRRLWPHPQDEQKFLFSPASMKELGTFRDVENRSCSIILADSQAGSSLSIIGSRYKQFATQTQGKNDRIKWCYSPIERCLSHKSLHLCAISQLATVEYSMVNANFADSTARPHPLYSRWSSSPPCHNSNIMSGWSLGTTWQLLKWLLWSLYSGDLPKSDIQNHPSPILMDLLSVPSPWGFSSSTISQHPWLWCATSNIFQRPTFLSIPT